MRRAPARDANSGGDTPHSGRAVDAHGIKYRSGGAIGGDARHLDERRDVHCRRAERGQTDRASECRPSGDAENADVGRWAGTAKEVEQSLFLRTVAAFPAEGDAGAGATERTFDERRVEAVQVPAAVDVRRARRLRQRITSEKAAVILDAQTNVHLALIESLPFPVLRRFHVCITRRELGVAEKKW